MISDNDTNFVGAVNELNKLMNQIDNNKIRRMTEQTGIRWNFKTQMLLISVGHMKSW